MYVIKDRCSVTSENFFKKLDKEKPSSHRDQSLYATNFTKDAHSKLNITNSQLSILKNQSPKLAAGIMRHKSKINFFCI